MPFMTNSRAMTLAIGEDYELHVRDALIPRSGQESRPARPAVGNPAELPSPSARPVEVSPR